VCFEVPEKRTFVDRIRSTDVKVVVAPSLSEIKQIVADSDIVQVEFWNHPSTLEVLHSISGTPIRLVVWSHISGVYNPIIPEKLVEWSNAFVVTSPSSLEIDSIRRCERRVEFISSAGGMEKLPQVARSLPSSSSCRFAYVGTTNFTKMHPDYVRYVAEVMLPDFQVLIFGDDRNRAEIELQCADIGRPHLVDFRGYSENIIANLCEVDVLVYLLNPDHYGTAEIALIEAMAMGVVPIVLDNPVERELVKQGVTGIVACSSQEVVAAIEMLSAVPSKRKEMSEAAKAHARSLYTGDKMARGFSHVYNRIIQDEKKPIPFAEIFGATPDKWFLSCQRNRFLYEGRNQIKGPIDRCLIPELRETSKGSVTHFSRYFPSNESLRRWKDSLTSLEVNE
jgi:hypothetical protein